MIDDLLQAGIMTKAIMVHPMTGEGFSRDRLGVGCVRFIEPIGKVMGGLALEQEVMEILN